MPTIGRARGVPVPPLEVVQPPGGNSTQKPTTVVQSGQPSKARETHTRCQESRTPAKEAEPISASGRPRRTTRPPKHLQDFTLYRMDEGTVELNQQSKGVDQLLEESCLSVRFGQATGSWQSETPGQIQKTSQLEETEVRAILPSKPGDQKAKSSRRIVRQQDEGIETREPMYTEKAKSRKEKKIIARW